MAPAATDTVQVSRAGGDSLQLVLQLLERSLLCPSCGSPDMEALALRNADRDEPAVGTAQPAEGNTPTSPESRNSSLGSYLGMLSAATGAQGLPTPAHANHLFKPLRAVQSPMSSALALTLADDLALPLLSTDNDRDQEFDRLQTDPYLQVLSRTDISDPKQRVGYIGTLAQNDGSVRKSRFRKGDKLQMLSELAVGQTLGTHTTHDDQFIPQHNLLALPAPATLSTALDE